MLCFFTVLIRICTYSWGEPMQTRDLTFILKRIAKTPVVLISGPRQSGKTSLVKTVFKNHKYLSFEDPDTLMFATSDPERFLNFYKNDVGIILDEAQRATILFEHIQKEVSTYKKAGACILVSSEKIPLEQLAVFREKIGTFTLLPRSLKESLEEGTLTAPDVAMLAHAHSKNVPDAIQYYATFLHSFMEREVTLAIQEKNVPIFYKFMQLCAGQVGQLLNFDILAEECGISFATAKQWLGILEKQYITFFLHHHSSTFGKRVTKSPKLYFFDTGMAAALLRIHTTEILSLHPLRSKLFENLIIVDLYKQFCNNGLVPKLFFWRDQNGRYDVECLIDTGFSLVALEIKSGETIGPDAFKKLAAWNKLSQQIEPHNFLIYAGTNLQKQEPGTLIGWHAASELIEQIDGLL